MPAKDDQLQQLKEHLGITPKTCNLLYDSGYTTPSSLRNSTPNEVVAKFAALPGMNLEKAKVYKRPLRRMTMLGDMDDLEEAKRVAKKCQKWSIKELVRLGVWEEGFDDLTGEQILRRMRAVGAVS